MPLTFYAYNAREGGRHVVAGVTRITKHRFPKLAAWRNQPGVASFRRKNEGRLPQRALDVLTCQTENDACLNCNDTTSNTCPPGQACYNLFKRRWSNIFSNNLMIKQTSNNMGYGVFVRTNRTIPRGTWIGEYVGELIPFDPNRVNGSNYEYDFHGNIARVDAVAHGNFLRFVNHACDNNVDSNEYTIGGRLCILFRARRNIVGGQELTLNYGAQFFQPPNLCRCSLLLLPHAARELESDSEEESDED
ncbi:uncharacterized protein BCR38DRAFT_487984 [Pseudomassariella vexata]|uniref:SET domain-containing protein n=1 Tax=Pseudomassariella vexata TaxID=1141098 RepID=A0A1Y2DNY6_9PEZI|nr:uncharacterized protein BCR38DRAFT_487984 [Pseudomassariella vexata]ORY60927.1 hypothetical protein BCR38DRAFT_487984 [Pseudomassariella vexata]